MFKKLATYGIAGGVALLIVALTGGLSWIITCGLVYLVTLCFGWTFKWAIATGIWLIMILAKSVFSHSTTVKK